MITRRNMLMGTMAGLVSAVVGCGQVAERQVDTNPNPKYGFVNLSTDKSCYNAGLIVDEDRDGMPDLIVPANGSSGLRYALFVREGFQPKSGEYIVDSRAKVMDNITLEAARQAMFKENQLNNTLKAYDPKQ
jgi:hypothetical protein